MSKVLRAELRLIRLEIKETGGQVLRLSLLLGLFIGIVVLGCIPFIAFMVVGLAQILGHNYWLSSLIISAAMIIFGGVSAGLVFFLMKNIDLTFPDTRETLSDEVGAIDQKIKEISKASHPSEANGASEEIRRAA